MPCVMAALRTAIGERSDAVLRTAMGERSDAVLRTAMGAVSQSALSPVNSHSNLQQSFLPFTALYTSHALLSRRRRRSRHLMTAQGAAADNACRDGAPRGARAPRKGPRAPGPPLPSEDLGPGSLACGRVSHTRPRRFRKPPGRLPALHPSPMGEARKTGRRAQPGVRKTKPRHSGALTEMTATELQLFPPSFAGTQAP
jgi:hypothetical protein